VLIAINLFGSPDAQYQFWVLIGALLSIVTLMFIVAFDKPDSE